MRIIFIFLTLSFVVASLVSYSYNTMGTRLLYRFSAAWLGLLFYLFLAALIYVIVSGIVSYIGFSFPVLRLGIALVCVALGIWLFGLVHAEVIQIKSVPISLSNIPLEWKNKKAIWISDLHLGQVHGEEFSKKVVASIQAQNPDVVFIGGDLFDGVKVDEDIVLKPFLSLHPPLGVFFITGNHEEFGDSGHFVDAVKRVGIRVLHNESVVVDGVQIIGVFDNDSSNRENFSSLLKSLALRKDMPTILLKHQPKDIDIAAEYGISLQISGHTHRAQMFPLGIVPRLVFKGFDYGLHSFGQTQVFTSSGVGTWGPPVRVGTDAEIVEFVFK